MTHISKTCRAFNISLIQIFGYGKCLFYIFKCNFWSTNIDNQDYLLKPIIQENYIDIFLTLNASGSWTLKSYRSVSKICHEFLKYSMMLSYCTHYIEALVWEMAVFIQNIDILLTTISH